MSRPDTANGRPAVLDQTIDTPSTDVPVDKRPTARPQDTDVKTGVFEPSDPNLQTGEMLSDASAQTGQFSPSDAVDPNSATGGYVAPPFKKPAKPGDVHVRGYEVLGELGRGGMGVVYKAKQVGLERLVALKMILAGAHAKQKDLDRFRAEAQAVARFQHPNIVQIYEVGDSDGLPFFSLEFVDGGTLADKIDKEPQTPKYAAEIMEPLARAMQYAHERNVVHRDLKPANVLMAADGTPKITDFGLAKKLEADSGQTQAGTVLGTPSYMAPEQAMGDTDKVGPQADVYSLGAMFYDLLTGRPPFSGSSVLDTLEMVRTREPVPPGQLTAKLPRDVETICLKCLQKEPHRRYASAGEFADDLRAYLEGRPIKARPIGPAERAWRWAKRNPVVAGLSTATAVLLVAVAIITSVMSYRINEKKKEAEAARDAAVIAEKKEAEQKEIAVGAQKVAVEQKGIAEVARDKAQKAQVTTGEQRNLALDVVRGISLDVDRLLGGKASTASMRRAIMEKMLSDVDKIRDHAAKNKIEDRTELTAMARLGFIYWQANRVQDAATHYRKAQAFCQQFLKENPEDPIAWRNLAAIDNSVAETEIQLGNAAGARDLYAESLRLRKKWYEMSPIPPARHSIAESHRLLGKIYLVLGEPAAALEEFRAAEADFAELPKEYTDNPKRMDIHLDVVQARNGIRDQVAVCLFKVGRPAEAVAEHQAALAQHEALVKEFPDQPAFRREVAMAKQAVGDFYLFENRDVGKALAEYAPAHAEYAAQAQKDPDDIGANQGLSGLEYRFGYAAERLAAHAPIGRDALARASRAHYEKCLALRLELAKADPKETHLAASVLVARARLGQADEVLKGAAALRKQAGADRNALFQTACGLAIASRAGTGPAADQCREQAFEVLGKLVESGWKDRVALATDPDLEAVRGDERFQKLLEKVPAPKAGQ